MTQLAASPAPHRRRTRLTPGIAALAIAAIPFAALLAQTVPAPYTVIETGQGFTRLQDAVDAIGDARGTIAIAPGRHEQCAVQQAGIISYFASEPGSAVFDGVTCEGKAALVLRGRGAEVSGLVFENMRVPDFNGAGIRMERGDLTVAESWFRDSQQGILTAQDPAARLIIDRSTFTRLGTCEGAGGCAHSVYTGELGHVRITNSRFEQGRGGHYVKSRAERVDIAASSFDDAAGRATNYMIDLPGGAAGQISNNWFVQGQDKENYSAFIAVAAEGRANDSSALAVTGNDARLAPGVERNTVFVADWSGDMGDVGENALGRGLARYERR
ncbi:MAG: right-handed parallel beta-helix repeat-containing protein [Alteraurantiacibacter sp.]